MKIIQHGTHFIDASIGQTYTGLCPVCDCKFELTEKECNNLSYRSADATYGNCPECNLPRTYVRI